MRPEAPAKSFPSDLGYLVTSDMARAWTRASHKHNAGTSSLALLNGALLDSDNGRSACSPQISTPDSKCDEDEGSVNSSCAGYRPAMLWFDAVVQS
jgi:hypothetical protein